MASVIFYQQFIDDFVKSKITVLIYYSALLLGESVTVPCFWVSLLQCLAFG